MRTMKEKKAVSNKQTPIDKVAEILSLPEHIIKKILKDGIRERLYERYVGGDRDFLGINLNGFNLRDLNLRGSDLRGADLSAANLYRADLRDANLSDANLSGAYLKEANLYGANLHGADLKDTILRNADLREANFTDADLRGADLRGSILPWCIGGVNAKIDRSTAAMLAYFFCAQECDDEDYLKGRNALLAFANLFPELYHEYSPCDLKPGCLAYREVCEGRLEKLNMERPHE